MSGGTRSGFRRFLSGDRLDSRESPGGAPGRRERAYLSERHPGPGEVLRGVPVMPLEAEMSQSMQGIRAFFDQKRLALVGVSRDAKKSFGKMVLDELSKRGYDLELVHPKVRLLAGRACHDSLASVQPAPSAVMILLSGEKALPPLREALEMGVRHIWINGVAGPKELHEEVRRLADASGANVVQGYCPFMFLPDTGFGHRLHGWIWKLVGLYPKQGRPAAQTAQ